MDKPVIVVNLSAKPDVFPYTGGGAAVGVRSAADLVPGIRRILHDEETCETLAGCREPFVREQVYAVDGQASKVTVALIKEMIRVVKTLCQE